MSKRGPETNQTWSLGDMEFRKGDRSDSALPNAIPLYPKEPGPWFIWRDAKNTYTWQRTQQQPPQTAGYPAPAANRSVKKDKGKRK